MTLLILCPVGENDMCHTVELSFIQSLSETPHLTTIRSNLNELCGFPIFNVFLKCLPEKNLYYLDYAPIPQRCFLEKRIHIFKI